MKRLNPGALRLTIAGLVAAWAIAACGQTQESDPCLDVDCSGHGVCAVRDALPLCVCEPGYLAQDARCVAQADPCQAVKCGGHGVCAVRDGLPLCVCDPGYRALQLDCVDEENPCLGVSCSGHGQCEVVDAEATCACEPDYAAQGLACVPADACAGVICSGHGQCTSHSGAAHCTCDPGYVPVNLLCVPAEEAGRGPIWFVHASDLHFGESLTVGRTLSTLVEEVLPTIEPAMTIISGDQTDGGSLYQWNSYRAVVDGAVPPYPAYAEIPGNHDLKDDNAEKFIAHAQTGRAGGGLDGQDFLETSAGRIRLVRANTSDASLSFVNIAGSFGEAQADALMALTDLEPPSMFPVVAGHHPVTGLEKLRLGADLMQDLLLQVGARVYFCGHVHDPDLSWLGGTLVVQATSLGKDEEPSFALVAIDDSGPAATFVPVGATVPWPQVLVTTPADPALGGDNPLAITAAPGSAVTVRAIAFSPRGVTGVDFKLGGRTAPGVAVRPHVWEATLAVPSGAEDLTLEAEAVDSAGERGRYSQELLTTDG